MELWYKCKLLTEKSCYLLSSKCLLFKFKKKHLKVISRKLVRSDDIKLQMPLLNWQFFQSLKIWNDVINERSAAKAAWTLRSYCVPRNQQIRNFEIIKVDRNAKTANYFKCITKFFFSVKIRRTNCSIFQVCALMCESKSVGENVLLNLWFQLLHF